MTDALLDLFEETARTLPATLAPAAPSTAHPHLARVVADSTNRVAWLRARSRGITGTDMARVTTRASVHTAALEKLHGSGFGGNRATEHGRTREPVIADWVRREHGILPSTALYRSAREPRHMATPDGLVVRQTGALELAEIKTTSKPWRAIPRPYLRQVWWQQYVLGAERTLVVWEQHSEFVPDRGDPQCRWVDRDEDQIAILVGLANALIDELHRLTTR